MSKEIIKSLWGTREEAEQKLCEIRAMYSEDKGFKEDDTFIEERENFMGEKQYRAVRTQHKEDQ